MSTQMEEKQELSVQALDQLLDTFLKNLPNHIDTVTPAFNENYEILSDAGWLDIEMACRVGNRVLVDHQIKEHKEGMKEDTKDVDFLIYHYWNKGLKGACHGNHRTLVDLMLGMGATDLNSGLRAACRGGYDDLVDHLTIEMGATGWGHGFQGACRGGHLALAHRMLEHDVYIWDWNSALMCACRGGHHALVDLVIEKSLGFGRSEPAPKPEPDHKQTIEHQPDCWMYSERCCARCLTKDNNCIGMTLIECIGCKREISIHPCTCVALRWRGSDQCVCRDCIETYKEQVVCGSCKKVMNAGMKLEVCPIVIIDATDAWEHRRCVSCRKYRRAIRWDYGLVGACRGGHRALVDRMIKMGATDYNWGLWQACIHNHRDLMDLMIEMGATDCIGEDCNLCLHCLDPTSFDSE